MPRNKSNFASALKSVQQPVRPTNTLKPSRSNRKHIGGYFDPTVSKQLKELVAKEDVTVQDLLAEALDMLFQARGMPTIARNS